MAGQGSGAWMAFMAMAFAVVGMTGLFATYALPIPMERMALRDTVFDDALTAATAPDPAEALRPLTERLGESAAPLQAAAAAGGAALAARVQVERAAMRAQMQIESDVFQRRLRWLVIVVTLMGGAFGCAVVGGFVRRSA